MVIIRIIGSLTALAFVAVVLARGLSALPPLDWTSDWFWAGACGGLIFYIFSQVIGGFSWVAILRIYGDQIPIGQGTSQLFVSQIAKYIPGNVLHLFGRVVLARADGIDSKLASKAMVFEVAILVIAALAVLLGLVLLRPELIRQLGFELPRDRYTWSVALTILAVLSVFMIGQIYLWGRTHKVSSLIRKLVLPFTFYLGNFGLLGVSVWFTTIAVTGGDTPQILDCMAIFTVAWVAGFLVPGAPGGIGVRDGLVALGLGIWVGPGPGLAVGLAHRVLSVLGDLIIFALGTWMRKAFNRS